MNTKNTLRILSVLAGLAGVAQFAGAQTFGFSIPGVFGGTNVPGVAINGSVTFSGSNTSIFVSNDSSVASSVTGIFLLNPIAADALALVDPLDATSDWDLVNSSLNVDNILSLSVTDSDYFGADLNPAGSPEGIAQGDNLSFSFTMGGTLPIVNLASFGNLQTPHILVRFQSVGDDGERSAAGYGWFEDSTTPPVPEPRLIAPLAVLGLGGLLYARRRIKGRNVKKA